MRVGVGRTAVRAGVAAVRQRAAAVAAPSLKSSLYSSSFGAAKNRPVLAAASRPFSVASSAEKHGNSNVHDKNPGPPELDDMFWGDRHGISYRLLDPDFSPQELFDFNKKHGSTPLNFIPDEPVLEHLSKIKTGETLVWGAFDGETDELVGFISGQMCGGYYHQTTHGQDATCFINEFVVSPEMRGKRIGVHLTAMSVDPVVGVFGVRPDIKEMYTTVHVENIPSRTAFIKGGYVEVISYDDPHRGRHTTVLKCEHPDHVHDDPAQDKVALHRARLEKKGQWLPAGPLVCSGCGAEVDGAATLAMACPNAASQPGTDHVLVPSKNAPAALREVLTSGVASADESPHPNPFVRYREFLYAYRLARDNGMSDQGYVSLVEEFDRALERVDGVGMKETPLLHWKHDADGITCFAKNESNSVAQSHKSRHLIGVMIYLKVVQALNLPAARSVEGKRLAVASCGNAGLAAAIVAAAAEIPISVFIPPDAEPAVVQRLNEVGADVHMCGRGDKAVDTPLGPISCEGAGDPTVIACRNIVAQHGAIPFSVQGSEDGIAVEGSQTLGLELVTALSRELGPEQLTSEGIDRVFIQIGGGALCAGVIQGLRSAVRVGALPRLPKVYPVQAAGNAPLNRAYQKVLEQLLGGDSHPPANAREAALTIAAHRRSEFMWPWDNPGSVAHGILDDETYDWLEICRGMLEAGSRPLVVDDDTILDAARLAPLGVQDEDAPPLRPCMTGVSGLAGLLQIARQDPADAAKPVDVVLFTGLDRT